MELSLVKRFLFEKNFQRICQSYGRRPSYKLSNRSSNLHFSYKGSWNQGINCSITLVIPKRFIMNKNKFKTKIRIESCLKEQIQLKNLNKIEFEGTNIFLHIFRLLLRSFSSTVFYPSCWFNIKWTKNKLLLLNLRNLSKNLSDL